MLKMGFAHEPRVALESLTLLALRLLPSLFSPFALPFHLSMEAFVSTYWPCMLHTVPSYVWCWVGRCLSPSATRRCPSLPHSFPPSLPPFLDFLLFSSLCACLASVVIASRTFLTFPHSLPPSFPASLLPSLPP